MSSITELKKDIAASLFILPASFEELRQRDFLKNKSKFIIERMLFFMENDGILYIKKDKYHTKKSWAKKNLQEYDIDFRTDQEKFIDGLSDFEKSYYGV